MNLRDLFVEEPIKKEEIRNELRIGGSFRCMDCGYDCDYAIQVGNKMSWNCPECGYTSSAKALF